MGRSYNWHVLVNTVAPFKACRPLALPEAKSLPEATPTHSPRPNKLAPTIDPWEHSDHWRTLGTQDEFGRLLLGTTTS